MELVTLAHVTLKRVGSASNAWVARSRELSIIREVSDSNPETIRELVVSVAESNGETRGHLEKMRQDNSRYRTEFMDAIVFDIHVANVQYSDPYAVCFTFPALKINERYFKLDEVKL